MVLVCGDEIMAGAIATVTLYLYNVTNDNHMYILFNTHLTIWYNLKIFPSKLATHCVILPESSILVLNMLSTSRRMMTDLRVV